VNCAQAHADLALPFPTTVVVLLFGLRCSALFLVLIPLIQAR
jgi:hypothetical protein